MEGTLPWTLIRDVSSKNPDEMLFSTEPFCSIISEVTLPEKDAAEFVTAAARFANDRLWGTLSCSMYVAPSTEKQPDMCKRRSKKRATCCATVWCVDQSLAGGGVRCDDAAVRVDIRRERCSTFRAASALSTTRLCSRASKKRSCVDRWLRRRSRPGL